MQIAFLIVFAVITWFYIDLSRRIPPQDEARLVRRYVNAVICVMILIAGLRNVAVGPDTFGYYRTFITIGPKPLGAVWQDFINYYVHGVGKDMGFKLLINLFYSVLPVFRFFLIGVSVLFFGAAGYIIRRHTSTVMEASLALLLFWALLGAPYGLTAVRQDIAMGLTMLSYHFIRKRQLVPFLVMVLVGSTIHKSCLIFTPYYWIAAIPKMKTLAWCTAFAMPALYYLARPLALFLAASSGSEGYMDYANSTFDSRGAYVNTILMLSVFVFFLLAVDTLRKTRPRSHYYTNALLITLGLSPLQWVDPALIRVGLYFTCFLPVVFSRSVSCLGDRNELRMMRILCLAALAFLLIKNAAPYDFFWNQMELGSNYKWKFPTAGI